MSNPESHEEIPSTATEPAKVSAASLFIGRPWLLPALTGVGGFILGMIVLGSVTAIGGAVEAASAQSQADEADSLKMAILPAALAACGLQDDSDSEIGDDGYSLTINNEGDDDVTGVDITDLSCLIEALNTPAAVRSHMNQTTSMDGRQSESWDDITVSWSYHPDRGMDSVFTVEQP